MLTTKVYLHDAFEKSEDGEFTYFDYLKNCNLNGNFSSFKETIKKLDHISLIQLMKTYSSWSNVCQNHLTQEIYNRMEKANKILARII